MRVLVTGHKGYIGTRLVPLLVAEGHHVVGLDSDLYERSTFGPPFLQVPEIRKDVRDAEREDVAGFDAVIHLAALSNDPLGNLNPDLTYEINHAATVRLAELARVCGVERFLFSSSCSTYGVSGEQFVSETAPLRPVTPYGVTKVMAEQDLALMADRRFSPTFLRNATVYGVSPRLRFDLVINNLTAWAMATGKVLLKSDGTPWRPNVHVEDVCRAFIAVLHADRAQIHNEAFNVGRSDENYQIRDLARIVAEVVPDCEVEIAPDAGPDTRTYRVDFSKIQDVLPTFQPAWTVRKGVKELYETYRQADVRVADFEGPRYKRVDQIRQLLDEGALDETLRFTTLGEPVLA